MLPQQLQTLISQFTKLPGIGPRQAARFVFYLLRNPQEISELENGLSQVREDIKLCKNCFLPAFVDCRICSDRRRNKNLICVVEKETDAVNLEKTRQFQGHYFILGGFIDPLEKESLAHERLNILTRRFENSPSPLEGEVGSGLELILALTPRREGDFTSLYIEEQLKLFPGIKITRLGRGLSSGAELEYADEETLRNALAGRK